MDKFVLMQNPVKWVTQNKGYSTIGLKELYPNKGYSSCDEYGYTDFISPYGNKIGKFAFLDEESENVFKGEKQINRDNFYEMEIRFAIVKLREKEAL